MQYQCWLASHLASAERFELLGYQLRSLQPALDHLDSIHLEVSVGGGVAAHDVSALGAQLGMQVEVSPEPRSQFQHLDALRRRMGPDIAVMASDDDDLNHAQRARLQRRHMHDNPHRQFFLCKGFWFFDESARHVPRDPAPDWDGAVAALDDAPICYNWGDQRGPYRWDPAEYTPHPRWENASGFCRVDYACMMYTSRALARVIDRVDMPATCGRWDHTREISNGFYDLFFWDALNAVEGRPYAANHAEHVMVDSPFLYAIRKWDGGISWLSTEQHGSGVRVIDISHHDIYDGPWPPPGVRDAGSDDGSDDA